MILHHVRDLVRVLCQGAAVAPPDGVTFQCRLVVVGRIRTARGGETSPSEGTALAALGGALQARHEHRTRKDQDGLQGPLMHRK